MPAPKRQRVTLIDVHTGPLRQLATMGSGNDSLDISESSANTASLDGGKGGDSLSEHQNVWGTITRTSF